MERIVAMQARAESEDRLNRIFQQAPIGMAVVSLDERFLRVNDALCRITGYDRETLLAMGPYEITHPDDVGAGRELTAMLLRGGAGGSTSGISGTSAETARWSAFISRSGSCGTGRAHRCTC